MNNKPERRDKMAFLLKDAELNAVIEKLAKEYHIYAPRLFEGTGTFSETDIIRYDKIDNLSQIVFDKKSNYSFKDAILPISETLFYFTEDEMRASKPKYKKAVVFLRNCDLHGVKRLDDIYKSNGNGDYYYERLRDNVKFIVMGCKDGFGSCFCESMGTNVYGGYDGYVEADEGGFIIDSKWDLLDELAAEQNAEKINFEPKPITNSVKVNVPDTVPISVISSPMWDEYNVRCISCGRCNVVCPTCTCYTMQDIFYEDNKNAGERRRVWASCHVDGFTDMAGGHSYRKTKGERMRFKVLHKISDHKKRFGHNMCVGCGRCDDICPEYISYRSCIEKVSKECGEVQNG